MKSKTLRRLTLSSLIYTIFALLGAGIAITENRPGEPLGWSSGLPAAQDFLYGIGTAMSPPAYLLAALAILTVLAPRHDRWGTVGVAGLAILGTCFSLGALVEPVLFEVFDPGRFDYFKGVIEAGLIVVPLAMLSFGLLELASRRRLNPAG